MGKSSLSITLFVYLWTPKYKGDALSNTGSIINLKWLISIIVEEWPNQYIAYFSGTLLNDNLFNCFWWNGIFGPWGDFKPNDFNSIHLILFGFVTFLGS